MELSDAIRGRRSVHAFRSDPVGKADLLAMLDAARWAPNAGNLQLWRFVVVEDRRAITELAAGIRDCIESPPEPLAGWRENAAFVSNLVPRMLRFSLFFRGAPVLIAALLRENAYNETVLKSMIDRGLSPLEAHRYLGFTEVQSVAAAIQNLLLTAHALGYGTCWMSVPFVAKDYVKERLGIRPPWDLLAMIPVGRPADAFPALRKSRKSVSEVVQFLGDEAGK